LKDGDGRRGLKLLDEDRDEGAMQGLRDLWLRLIHFQRTLRQLRLSFLFLKWR